MSKQFIVVLYVLAMAVVIAGVDVLFFKDRFWNGSRPISA